MSQKITGYVLLIVGICLMAFALNSVYNVFTQKVEPVQLFDFPGISLNLDQGTNIVLPQEVKDSGIEISQAKPAAQEIVSPQILNQSSNIFAHIILMGFMVNVGFKVAMLGVETNREVKVTVSNRPLGNKKDSVLLPNSQSLT